MCKIIGTSPSAMQPARPGAWTDTEVARTSKAEDEDYEADSENKHEDYEADSENEQGNKGTSI